MKNFDWSKARRDKGDLRERNAGESLASKLQKLDRLRERSQAIKGGTVRRPSASVSRTPSTDVRRKK